MSPQGLNVFWGLTWSDQAGGEVLEGHALEHNLDGLLDVFAHSTSSKADLFKTFPQETGFLVFEHFPSPFNSLTDVNCVLLTLNYIAQFYYMLINFIHSLFTLTECEGATTQAQLFKQGYLVETTEPVMNNNNVRWEWGFADVSILESSSVSHSRLTCQLANFNG